MTKPATAMERVALCCDLIPIKSVQEWLQHLFVPSGFQWI